MLVLKAYLLVGALFTTTIVHMATPDQRRELYEEWSRYNNLGQGVFWLLVLTAGTLFWPLIMVMFIRRGM